MPWISAKNLKPGNTNNVLLNLVILWPEYKIGFCHDGKFFVIWPEGQSEDVTKWVTHWHELPPPPKE